MKLPPQHRIWVDGAHWDFERPILETRKIGETMIVVFDYMNSPQQRQARNLMAFNLERELLWIAEHPTDQPTDAYVSILEEQPFIVSNFAGFECELDLGTGKLLNAAPAK